MKEEKKPPIALQMNEKPNIFTIGKILAVELEESQGNASASCSQSLKDTYDVLEPDFKRLQNSISQAIFQVFFFFLIRWSIHINQA